LKLRAITTTAGIFFPDLSDSSPHSVLSFTGKRSLLHNLCNLEEPFVFLWFMVPSHFIFKLSLSFD